MAKPFKVELSYIFDLKLLVSFLFFLFEVIFWSQKKKLKRFRYVFRFESDYLYDGIALGKQFFHSIEKYRVDRSTKSTPTALAQVSKEFADQTIGVSSCENSTGDQSTLLETLNLSSKHHDWEANAVYYVPLDNVLSNAIVIFLRWTTWFTIVFSLISAFVLKLDSSIVGKLMEISLFIMDVFDAQNLSSDQLTPSTTKKESLQIPFRRRIYDLMKSVTTSIFPESTIWFDFRIAKWVQYFSFIICSFVCGRIVNALLVESEIKARRD